MKCTGYREAPSPYWSWFNGCEHRGIHLRLFLIQQVQRSHKQVVRKLCPAFTSINTCILESCKVRPNHTAAERAHPTARAPVSYPRETRRARGHRGQSSTEESLNSGAYKSHDKAKAPQDGGEAANGRRTLGTRGGT